MPPRYYRRTSFKDSVSSYSFENRYYIMAHSFHSAFHPANSGFLDSNFPDNQRFSREFIQNSPNRMLSSSYEEAMSPPPPPPPPLTSSNEFNSNSSHTWNLNSNRNSSSINGKPIAQFPLINPISSDVAFSNSSQKQVIDFRIEFAIVHPV